MVTQPKNYMDNKIYRTVQTYNFIELLTYQHVSTYILWNILFNILSNISRTFVQHYVDLLEENFVELFTFLLRCLRDIRCSYPNWPEYLAASLEFVLETRSNFSQPPPVRDFKGIWRSISSTCVLLCFEGRQLRNVENGQVRLGSQHIFRSFHFRPFHQPPLPIAC